MNTNTISTHFTCPDHEYILSNGDRLKQQKKSLILTFAGKRKVLSTSAFHGGYGKDFTCVFNFDEKPESGSQCKMRASTYEEHLKKIAAQELSLDPSFCTGLSTAADMKNTAIETIPETITAINNDCAFYECSDKFPPVTVTAIVTGGIDKNGARAGDSACWTERNGRYIPVPGTINIFLHINANLSEGAMARALVTCTEAKTAAVTELFCPSLYSSGLATGSGTDGVILICDLESPVLLTAAGKDSRLGEMIAKTVIPAVKKAIGLQTGVTQKSQHHALRRLERFGLTENKLYEIYLCGFSLRKSQKKAPEKADLHFSEAFSHSEALSKTAFFQAANPLLASGYWTGKASLLAHLFDQLQWEMLSLEEIPELVRLLFPSIEWMADIDMLQINDSGVWTADFKNTDIRQLPAIQQILQLFCEEFLRSLF